MKNLAYLIAIYFLVGCSTQSNIENKNIIPEAPLLKSKKKGYFNANGREPYWSLEISEEIIRFQGVESNNEFNAPHIEPSLALDTNVKLYRVNTESGDIEITISNQICFDGMSEQKYDYKVDINLKINNKKDSMIYSGCGNYIADYRLFDLWLLEELNGKKVTVENFSKEIPTLEINSSEKKFFGYGGCNHISGKIVQERELLRFESIISTRMACGENNSEYVFLKALQNSTGYKIKNNRLYLTNPDSIKVIFKKID